jgi:hypothetical protein
MIYLATVSGRLLLSQCFPLFPLTLSFLMYIKLALQGLLSHSFVCKKHTASGLEEITNLFHMIQTT